MGQAKQRGTFEQRKAQAEGLLDLATARTGREVNMDTVQILDEAAFGRLNQAMMEVASRMLAAKKAMSENDFPMVADAQDDGRLVIRVNVTDLAVRVIEIPAGGWHELTKPQYAEITKSIDARLQANPGELSGLMDALQKEIVSGEANIRRHEERSAAEIEKATQVVMVFDRSAESLEIVRTVRTLTPGLSEHLDAWLATENDFFVLHYPRGGIKWMTTAANLDALLREVLPAVAERAGSAVQTAIIRCNESPNFNTIRDRWRELGGLVP